MLTRLISTKYGPFLSVLLQSYRNSKFSLCMLMTSLIIAAAGLSAVLVINSSAKQSYSSDQQFLIPNVTHTISASDPQFKLTKQDYAELRLKGFDQLIAVAQTKQTIYTNSQANTENDSAVKPQPITQRRIELIGVDTYSLFSLPSLLINDQQQKHIPLSEQTSLSTRISKKNSISNDSLISSLNFNQSSAILHPQLLEQLQASANSKRSNQSDTDQGDVTPNYVTQEGMLLPELKSVENNALGNNIIMDIADLYRLYPNIELSMLLVVGELSITKRHALEQSLPRYLQLTDNNTGEQDAELTSSFHLNLMAMALLMFVVCLFIVVNAVNLLLSSRLVWLKICRQLGISRRQLFTIQLIEMVMLTFLASFIGVILGIELAKIASPAVQETLENLYSVEVGFVQVSLIGLLIQVTGICLVGTICATFIPLNKLNHQLAQSKDVPLTSAQQKVWKSLTWLGCIVFGLGAFVLLYLAKSLALLLMATALLILSGCFLLLANYPSLLLFIQRFIPAKYPLLQVSTKQSVALSGKTKIACCAFFIAATSNIGMNLMVDSFRGATVGWLDQRITADYYVSNQGKPNISALAEGTGVEVYARLENTIRYKNSDVEQASYPTEKLYQEAMAFYDTIYDKSDYDKSDEEGVIELWQDFANGKGVLVNQQFAFGFGYEVNDKIDLPHPSTQAIASYKILGIVYDFGSPYRQVLMPLDMFEVSQSKCCVYALHGDEAGIDLIRSGMKTEGADPDQSLLRSEELFAISMQTFDDTFVITDGLNIVTLLVAALSLACAIIVLMNDIRPQNMLIRSMGVSAIKTQLLSLFQYLLLCVVALLFATPFGILLSWILITEINYQAFSWTYPLIISPVKILQIYATSLMVVSIVIIIPIIRAGKRPLIEDIRWVN